MSEKGKINFRDILLIVNSVLLLALIVVVSYMYIRIFNPFKKQPDLTQSLRIINNTSELLKGSQFTGNSNGKIVIFLFNSFSCGWCAHFKPVLLQAVKNFPADVKLVYRHYNRSESDIKSAMAVECAGEQKKFWEMYESLFDESNLGDINAAAKAIGINNSAFNKCIASNKYKQKSINDSQEGRQMGITGTPAFIVNNKMYEGYRPYEVMEKIIQNELKTIK